MTKEEFIATYVLQNTQVAGIDQALADAMKAAAIIYRVD